MAKAKTPYEVDRLMAEWLIVALILFALVVEVILHKLEHWISHKHNHLQTILRNVYREIMILGMVSFGFIMYIFIASPSGEIKLTFEVAHIWIFLFVCFHTFVVMSTVFISLRLSNRWKNLERMELVTYLEKKEQYRKLMDRIERKSTRQWKLFGWWFPKVGKLYKHWKLHEVMAFHDIRFQFIYYRNLPMDFRFSSFLRKIKANTFIELVEIHWTHFLFMLGIVLLDIARVVSNANFGKYFEPAFLIAESCLNAFLVTLLGWKIRKIYWKMTRNPATYYDQVDRHSLEMERLIESELKKIKNESQPQSRRMSRTFERKSVDKDVNNDDGDEEPSIRKSVDMDRPRMSTDRRSRRPSHAGSAASKHESHGHGAGAHKPIYQNLAYVPPKSIPSSGTATPSAHEDDLDVGNVVARHSLDVNRETYADANKGSIDITTADRPSARSSFDKPRKYEPTSSLTNKDGSIAMDAVANAAARRRNEGRSSIEASGRFSRTSQDGPQRRLSNASRPDRRVSRDRRDSNASRRTSVDLSMTLPVEDLADRARNTRKLKSKRIKGDNQPMVVDMSDDEVGMDDMELRKLALKRLKQKERPNPGLVNLHKENEAAKTATIESKYPKWLVKCLPRLGRIASPAEKLFWFGSPKYYLWCVEWVLFFTTVNLATTLAKVGTLAKKRNDPSKVAKVTARLVEIAVHQATKKNATATPFKSVTVSAADIEDSFFLLMIALLVAFITLFYVLFRIADVMKKYIFVLNNANMIPETMTIEAIQTIRVKDIAHGKGIYHSGNDGDESPSAYAYVDGSDTEVEDGEFAKGRHDLTSFFNKEAQAGRQPGALPIGDAKEQNPRRVSVSSRRTSEQIDEVEAVAETNDWDGRADKV